MDIDAVVTRGLDREILLRLSRRSDARGMLQLCIHVALLCTTGFIVWASQDSLLLVPAIVAHGIVLNFLFCPLHETIHRTAFASRRINTAVGWIFGSLLVLPPNYFRYHHFAHHRFTQDPALDPDLAEPGPSSVAVYLWRASGIPNWRSRLSMTLRHALTGRVTESYVPTGMQAAIAREARILWICYAVVLALSIFLRRADALIYWILPLVAGGPLLRLYLMAEHTDCPFTRDMFTNTRTTYTNGVVRLLAWQMPYHAEHHCYPSVPFHALAKVNEHIRNRIEVTAPGYIAFHLGLLRQYREGAPAREQASVPRELVADSRSIRKRTFKARKGVP